MQEDPPVDQSPPTVPQEQQRLLITLHEHNFKNWKTAQDTNPNNARQITIFLGLWKMSHDALTTILGKEEVQKGSLGWDPYVEERKLLAKTSNGFIGLNQNPHGSPDPNRPYRSLAQIETQEPTQSMSSAGPVRNDNHQHTKELYKKSPQAQADTDNMHSMLAFSKAYYRAVKGISKSKNKGQQKNHKDQA
ncbi:uncharacterized protein MELLADRAFT_64814 [Melampsora larici-populina 98AG31]|uniref:Uncharacterized protein n=1 Tax=Melampsora larici-populina (strain 98AG31 / pathotype 3-4-7) TaxID=747676 RepID=F4RSW9_MELLP|nr:uncharacterized protein MELLADRAFT_64814 [Melampsora larici-populina 98AG31]EGG04401.1 hypothetical protein MELLADRAFT_64814 [Melampsora larici-populina 98AG31]